MKPICWEDYGKTYDPSMDSLITPELRNAERTLVLFFEGQGSEFWEFGGVSSRALRVLFRRRFSSRRRAGLRRLLLARCR